MKKTLFVVLAALLCCNANVNAQGFLKGLADKAKQKVKEKIEQKVEDKVGNAADGALNGKNNNSGNDEAEAEEQASVGNQKSSKGADEKDPTINTSTDFVRGSKILFQDDFKNEKVGEFPSKWDLNAGKAEVKNFNGQKVVEITDNGFITPLIKQKGAYLTEEFTVEFDYYYWPNKEDIGLNDIKLILAGSTDRASDVITVWENDDAPVFNVDLPVCDGSDCHYHYNNGSKVIDTSFDYKFSKGWHTVAISFNKRALKLYIDGNRVANLPKVKQATWVGIQVPFDYENLTFIRNVVIAQGAVELYDRNAQDLTAVEKAMQETGKFVTNNILFETGKANLKPESMTEIQKVAEYMKKNPNARFLVVGHTDNVGKAESNQTLSENRAKSVVAALAKLGVDDFNLKAEGRGASEPVADNKTDEGKAKNRRVEFIKK